jgi:uncharacterized protein (DUF1015 family)
MANILPFSTVFYNQEKFNKSFNLLSPPYEQLDPNKIKNLSENNFNFINLLRPEDIKDTKQNVIKNKFLGWLLRDILVVDKIPALYVHEEDFVYENREVKKYGIIGLLNISDNNNNIGIINKINDSIAEEKYLHIKETQSNFESLICSYKDKEKIIESRLNKYLANVSPVLKLDNDSSHINKLFRIDDGKLIKDINEFFKDKKIYITFGQNFYNAELKNKNDNMNMLGNKYSGKEPFNFIMANLYNFYDDSLFISPVNRLIKISSVNVKDLFKQLTNQYKMSAIEFENKKMELLARKKMRLILSSNKKQGKVSFGLFVKSIQNRYFILTLNEKNENSDIDILDNTVINSIFGLKENIDQSIFYKSDDNETFESVKSGNFDIAFFLNPINIENIIEISDNNINIPDNSFQYYPEPLCGLTIFSYKYSKIQGF